MTIAFDEFFRQYRNQEETKRNLTPDMDAYVDETKWGIGVYTPITSNFLARMAGTPDFESTDSQTSYIAPIKTEALSKTAIFENDHYLFIGNLDEIRSQIYRLNEKLD